MSAVANSSHSELALSGSKHSSIVFWKFKRKIILKIITLAKYILGNCTNRRYRLIIGRFTQLLVCSKSSTRLLQLKGAHAHRNPDTRDLNDVI